MHMRTSIQTVFCAGIRCSGNALDIDFQCGRCKKCEMNPMKTQQANKEERSAILSQYGEYFHLFCSKCLDFIFIFLNTEWL